MVGSAVFAEADVNIVVSPVAPEYIALITSHANSHCVETGPNGFERDINFGQSDIQVVMAELPYGRHTFVCDNGYSAEWTVASLDNGGQHLSAEELGVGYVPLDGRLNDNSFVYALYQTTDGFSLYDTLDGLDSSVFTITLNQLCASNIGNIFLSNSSTLRADIISGNQMQVTAWDNEGKEQRTIVPYNCE